MVDACCNLPSSCQPYNTVNVKMYVIGAVVKYSVIKMQSPPKKQINKDLIRAKSGDYPIRGCQVANTCISRLVQNMTSQYTSSYSNEVVMW